MWIGSVVVWFVYQGGAGARRRVGRSDRSWLRSDVGWSIVQVQMLTLTMYIDAILWGEICFSKRINVYPKHRDGMGTGQGSGMYDIDIGTIGACNPCTEYTAPCRPRRLAWR
jgi:hypothetical protein